MLLPMLKTVFWYVDDNTEQLTTRGPNENLSPRGLTKPSGLSELKMLVTRNWVDEIEI